MVTEFPGKKGRPVAPAQNSDTSGPDRDVPRVAEALQSVCSTFADKLQDAQITLIQNYDRDATVAADADELRQVFSSLVSNAIDAMPDGGSLQLEVRADGENVQIVIADTGHGILADKRPHIFRPFYTTKGEKGVGIGLWIARSIIEKAGGSIELENSPAQAGCGARFLIRLPAAGAPSQELEKCGAA